MDDLQRVQNGDLSHLRSNEAGRWAANDILRKGNPYRSYDMLPAQNGPNAQPGFDGNYVKIPQEFQHQLTEDELRIARLRMDAKAIGDQRMQTPVEMKQHLHQKA